MDEVSKKQDSLLRIREDAHAWMDNTKQGGKFIGFHEENLRQLEKEVSSEKYVNDHNAYLVALGQIKAHRTALNAVNTANERASKAIKELEQLQESLDSGA